MLINEEHVIDFISQRAPIVMVGGLKEYNDHSAVSVFTIKPDNIFVSDGFFSMPGLIENIAQTVALSSGYSHVLRAKSDAGEAMKPPVGFIGEIKNLTILFLPPIGSLIETKVELLHTIFTASVIKGTVFCNGEVAAECEMKVFVQP